MTITSLFNAMSATNAYSYGSGSVNPTSQTVLDALAKASGAADTTIGNGVSISTDAKLAAANAADNAKDFDTLTSDVRKSLDDGSGKLGDMSGRALAAIILNRSSSFSRSEAAAAKAELNSRTRQDFTALAGSASALGGLSSYNAQLVSQYDAISDEERTARGWTPATRSSAESFVQSAQTISSLFDQIDQADQADRNNPG